MAGCEACVLASNGDPPRAVADTSVAVPALLAVHPDHVICVAARDRHAAAIAGHAWFETLSVLTRMGGTTRASPRLV